MVGEHGDDADEAERRRRPAIEARGLALRQRGQRNDHQRRGEGERGGGEAISISADIAAKANVAATLSAIRVNLGTFQNAPGKAPPSMRIFWPVR